MASKSEYHQESTKMWDISADAWDDFDDVGNLWVVTLSIDEPNMDVVSFTADTQERKEIDTNPIARQ